MNDKQKIIAMGAKREQSVIFFVIIRKRTFVILILISENECVKAYPTMDDIPSDWDSKEEEDKGSRVEIGPKKKAWLT